MTSQAPAFSSSWAGLHNTSRRLAPPKRATILHPLNVKSSSLPRHPLSPPLVDDHPLSDSQIPFSTPRQRKPFLLHVGFLKKVLMHNGCRKRNVKGGLGSLLRWKHGAFGQVLKRRHLSFCECVPSLPASTVFPPPPPQNQLKGGFITDCGPPTLANITSVLIGTL